MSTKFFQKAQEVLDAQSGKNVGNGAHKLVRASEFSIHFPPGAPRHLTEPRVWKMPSNSPAGVAAWEAESIALQAKLAANEIDLTPKPAKKKPSTFNPSILIERT